MTRKYKIILTKGQRAKLAKTRDVIAAALALSTQATAKTDALQKEKAALDKEIAPLESTETLTDAVIQKLSIKREKLRLIAMRIEADDARCSDEEGLRQILLDASPFLREPLVQVHDQVKQELRRDLAKIYGPSQIENHLGDAPALRSIGQYLNFHFGLMGNPVAQAREAIARIDAFLAGKCPWKRTN